MNPIKAKHDGFMWEWDQVRRQWLLDVAASGGPPGPQDPPAVPPPWIPVRQSMLAGMASSPKDDPKHPASEGWEWDSDLGWMQTDKPEHIDLYCG